MNVNTLKPFVEAVSEVMNIEVGVTVVKGDLELQKSSLTTNDITVLLHLVGEVYGVVLYSLSQSVGLKMVSKILGQDFREFNSLAQSGIAELGNVITGRATVKLSQAGYDTNISPPTVITGREVKISTLDFPRIVVPLKTDLGNMEVHLAVRESTNGKHMTPEEFVSLTIPRTAA